MMDHISRQTGYDPNSEMGLIGYIIAAGVALILLPVLPFVALIWLVAEFRDNEPERSYAG